MKIALSNIAWEPSEDVEIAGLMAEFEIGAVEIAPTKIWPAPVETSEKAAKDARATWGARGIVVSSLQALLFGHAEFALFGSENDRRMMGAYLARIACLGGWLGARPLVFGSPKNRIKGDLSFEKAIGIAAPFICQVGEACRSSSTVLCLEPNPPEYGCDFMTNTEEAIQFVEAVNHPSVRLHLDSGIMTMNGEDPLTWVPKAAPWLEHFHISEPNLAVVGGGKVDHPRFARALRGIGYGGWVSIEMRSGWNIPDSVSVRQALELASNVYG